MYPGLLIYLELLWKCSLFRDQEGGGSNRPNWPLSGRVDIEDAQTSLEGEPLWVGLCLAQWVGNGLWSQTDLGLPLASSVTSDKLIYCQSLDFLLCKMG